MLATLNSKQIVDEIVKDTIKDNDPHDAVQISPDIVPLARPISVAPTLAPEVRTRPEPKFAPGPRINLEPKFAPVAEPEAAAPSVDTAVRVAASDGLGRQKRSSTGKWLRGAFVTFLLAGASAAATIGWEKHGDTAKQMLAEWKPMLESLASLIPATSQTAPVATAEAAAPPVAPAVTEQTPDQPVPPPPAQAAAVPVQAVAPAQAAAPTQAAAVVAPAATQPDPAQSMQSMTNDLAAMARQIEQLKANIAELKAGQEQMAREMAKPPAPQPVAADTKPVEPRARAAALPPRPAAPPARKPKPAVTRTYMPAYSPGPLAPPLPPSQAAAVPPPAPPIATTQAVADDDGPIVRPPMPLR